MLDTIKTYTFPEIAREYLRDADGDTQLATERLSARLRDDKQLRDTIVEDAIMAFASNTVEEQMRAERRAVWAEAGRSNQPKTPVAALANGISRALLDFPLRNGKRLRDATREEVLEQARAYETSARDMAFKARWLILIGQRVEEGRKVGECVSEDDAFAMRSEAQSLAIVLEAGA